MKLLESFRDCMLICVLSLCSHTLLFDKCFRSDSRRSPPVESQILQGHSTFKDLPGRGQLHVLSGTKQKTYRYSTTIRLWPFILKHLHPRPGQNDIYEWARDHRVHHKYSETDADPHNAVRGFFFAHIGWLLVRKHPDVIEKGRKLELHDLLADKVVMFQRK